MAVKLTAAGERNVKNGHPWIFTNSIQKINNNAFCGDIAIIFGRAKNKVIGVGLYDSKSSNLYKNDSSWWGSPLLILIFFLIK